MDLNQTAHAIVKKATDTEFIAEIIIRKTGDQFEAEWSGESQKFFSAGSPVEALMKVAVAVDAGLR